MLVYLLPLNHHYSIFTAHEPKITPSNATDLLSMTIESFVTRKQVIVADSCFLRFEQCLYSAVREAQTILIGIASANVPVAM